MCNFSTITDISLAAQAVALQKISSTKTATECQRILNISSVTRFCERRHFNYGQILKLQIAFTKFVATNECMYIIVILEKKNCDRIAFKAQLSKDCRSTTTVIATRRIIENITRNIINIKLFNVETLIYVSVRM